MITNLAIADEIEKKTSDKNLDQSCKNILSNIQILARILKACVLEFKDISLEEIPAYIEYETIRNEAGNDKIKGMNTEDHTISGATIRYDVLFTVKIPGTDESIGLIINVEAQNYKPSYPLLSRAVYYCARLIARQKNQAEGFDHSDFQNLKKVYSIWIVMNSAKKKEGVFNQYTIKEECLRKTYHFPKEDYDKLSIIMLYPNNEYDKNEEADSFMNMLYILFKAEMTPEDKKYQLCENYGILMTKELAKEVEDMCNLSQGIRDEARAEGLAKGRAEGMARGRAKGLSEAVKSLMNSMNLSMDKAMDCLNIAKDIRPAVIKNIENEKK